MLHGSFKIDNGSTDLFFARNNAIELNYSGSKKLETTNTGVTVTGTVTATSYAGDGSSLTGVGGENDITSCLFI